VGLPLEEIARTLDIPAGTARSRLFRALESMRGAIEADSRAPADGPTIVSKLSSEATS
jgi:DNA-directed RNA polymerase specialized sigma24 family protein